MCIRDREGEAVDAGAAAPAYTEAIRQLARIRGAQDLSLIHIFHDAGWQEKFGGDWYVEHGSHGCINLPPDKAEELHGLLSVGDVVVVHELSLIHI